MARKPEKPKAHFTVYGGPNDGAGRKPVNRDFNEEIVVYVWSGDGGLSVHGTYDEEGRPYLKVETQHPGGGNLLGEIRPGQAMRQDGWRNEDCLVLGGGGAVYRDRNHMRTKHQVTLLKPGGYGVVREVEVATEEEAKRLFREFVAEALAR